MKYHKLSKGHAHYMVIGYHDKYGETKPEFKPTLKDARKLARAIAKDTDIRSVWIYSATELFQTG